jgi:membrane protease YdiL (CAAX protease family)
MIEAHKKKANIAAGIWLVTVVTILVMVFTGNMEGNIWDTGNVPAIAVMTAQALSFLAALWWYAKAKGYWGVLGIGLALLNLIGLIIIAVLPDRRKDDAAHET